MEGKSGPHAQPSAAALSPDRKRIAWGAGRREPGTPLRFRTDIEVVDAGTGKVQLVLRGHTGRGICVSIAFSGDGRRIVSGGRDGTVRLWDAETGQEMLTFRGLAPVMSVAFSLDDQRIIAGSEDGTIWEWEAPLAKAEPGKAK
jgi:WD40 repeat protein